ncbi:MAG: hypothetical protein ACKO9I_22570 [Sphaerospermopsis kisseleviana]|jgi:medium-chain acyl-[acyl-carrier-protein] hydrolase|uniref:Thioesterase n=1 Tax=Sphaerospermopsis reniformis TaxID=531300 RepID=A0A479ZZA9_9CYAN|nr:MULTISPECIES: hypothetical protein [Sphaerospermopsis]GCL35184.1 thioesterase [Sphaerospermopsis reniformis]
MSVFGGLQDPAFTDYELESWQEHTNAGFSLHKFPGNHFFYS